MRCPSQPESIGAVSLNIFRPSVKSNISYVPIKLETKLKAHHKDFQFYMCNLLGTLPEEIFKGEPGNAKSFHETKVRVVHLDIFLVPTVLDFGIFQDNHLNYTDRFVLLVVEGHAGHRVETHPHRGREDEGDAKE